MESELQPSMFSSPSVYVTAPNTPNPITKSNSSSAPVSPRRKTSDSGSSFDDFEFETGMILGSSKGDQDDIGLGEKRKNRGLEDSLPSMAFADELFFNGLVMPLKLPPRLQYDSDLISFSQRSSSSPASSPKSPRMACRFPFGRRNAWNDDFDPFMVALQKVREEKTGRNGQHRRSRSHSPFRTLSKCPSDLGSRTNDLYDKENIPTHTHSGPLEFKGSAYKDQTESPAKIELTEENVVGGNGETKVQKLKGFLTRYASFGRAKSSNMIVKKDTEAKKLSYFSRLSFKFKQNGNGSGKKRMPSDKSMAVVEYKPSMPFALCLGYGAGSPKKMN